MHCFRPFPAASLAILLMLPSALIADTSDHLNVRPPQAPDYQKSAPGEAFILPTVPSAPHEVARPVARRLVLREVAFRGNTVIVSGDLAAVAAPFLGRELGDADLETLRQALTRHYVERGYVNSGALLGEVRDGILDVDIVEGRLSAIRLTGLERLDEDYVVRRLVRDENAVLNVEDLRERFLLLLEDPLFERINARLVPGQRPGEAVLDLVATRAQPYRLTAFANNYRPPSIGSEGIGLTGLVRNVTGRGDVFDATWQQSTTSDPSTRYNLGWRIPLTQRGTLLSIQYDHGRSAVVEEPLRALDIRSVLDSTDLGVSQNLVETLAHKFTVGINRVFRENRTTLLGRPFSFSAGEPDGVTKVRAWRFWQEYGYRTENQALALRYTLTQAHNNLQDPSALLPATTTVQPDHDYRIWLGQIQYARRLLDNGTQLVLRGSRQGTSANLPSIDRMAVGGVYTVRGYRENQLIRDEGTVANVELDIPVLRGDGGSLNLIPFFDWGRGKNRNEQATVISSAGLAARARWQGVAVDLALARRLAHPDSVSRQGGNLQDDGVHLQVSYNFF